MLVMLVSLGFGARRDQAQDRADCRLRRSEIFPPGSRTPDLGTPRDKRHLLLVFHDRMTRSRTFIIAPTQVFAQPPFGVSAFERPLRCPDQVPRMRIRAAPVDRRSGALEGGFGAVGLTAIAWAIRAVAVMRRDCS
jgi:hypothetical protein